MLEDLLVKWILSEEFFSVFGWFDLMCLCLTHVWIHFWLFEMKAEVTGAASIMVCLSLYVITHDVIKQCRVCVSSAQRLSRQPVWEQLCDGHSMCSYEAIRQLSVTSAEAFRGFSNTSGITWSPSHTWCEINFPHGRMHSFRFYPTL